MNIKQSLLGVIVLTLVLSACGAPAAKPDAMKDAPTTDAMMAAATATPDAMMQKEMPTADAMMAEATPTADAMMQHDMPTADAMMAAATPASDAMMAEATGTPDAMMIVATPTPDAMMQHDMPTADTMMAAATPASDAMMTEATGTPDAMMAMATPTPDAMMQHDMPTADAMMAKATPTADAMMGKSDMAAPAWFGAKLTDVNTGKSFEIADFKGKVVLVETMAVWCTTCLQQQGQIQMLHSLLGKQADLVSLSLDIDPNENSNILKTYLNNHSFDWMYAVAPADTAREIGKLYGDQFLNPPSAPMFIIDREGQVHTLPFGVKSAQDLKAAVEMYLKQGM